MVIACPGCGRTTSTVFQELAERIQSYLRQQMPVWRGQYPGVEEMHVAVMGCVVNGPGESKHANIGISLPGSGETPVAPVFVDGGKTVTLKGERIAEEFQAIVEDYVRTRYGAPPHAQPRARRTPSAEVAARPCRSDAPIAGSPMSETIQAIRGMNDVLPDEAPLWRVLRGHRARPGCERYGYRHIRTPIVERTELFVRSIGEVTDIVEKEMYTFTDQLNGDSLTLRPEGTASCVRAAIEHNLLYGGASASGMPGPCSGTSGRRRAATGSSTRSVSKRSVSPGRTWTPNSS